MFLPIPLPVFPARRCAFALLALALAACGAPETPGAADEARAAQMRPHDAALAEKYERSCMVSHAQIAAQAPLTGASEAGHGSHR